MKPTLLLAGFLALAPFTMPAACSPVLAETADPGSISAGTGPASLTIRSADGKSLAGRSFRFWRLFDAQSSADGESVRYTWNPETETALRQAVAAGLDVSPDAVTEAQASNYIDSLSDNETALRSFLDTVRKGLGETEGISLKISPEYRASVISVTGLENGWYLADEAGEALTGQHAAASLLMVSTALPDAQLKVKSAYPSVIKQILEDDGDTGWNDIGDYMYGQDIPYRFETTVPEISGYRTWMLAFEDRMDPALDLLEDTITVTLSKNGRSYTLQPEEYEITKQEGGLTFRVRIPDLKAICDREFAEEGYGQKVELRYDARFNDQIRDRFESGRNAFENSVRMEFSNDPDTDGDGRTGYTPWDTVVCYTYQIAGLKINEKETKLANAAFRLYADEACTQEIGFEKAGDAWLPSDTAQEILSDENGRFRLDGLDQGTYWLKEVKAPAGYRPLQAPVKITITPEFPEDRNSYVAGGTGLTGLKAEADDSPLAADPANSQIQLTVLNRTGSLLPKTGSSLTIVILVTAAGLGAAGLALMKKR